MGKALYVELEEPVAGPPSLFQPLPRDTEIWTNTGDVCVRGGAGGRGGVVRVVGREELEGQETILRCF